MDYVRALKALVLVLLGLGIIILALAVMIIAPMAVLGILIVAVIIGVFVEIYHALGKNQPPTDSIGPR